MFKYDNNIKHIHIYYIIQKAIATKLTMCQIIGQIAIVTFGG